MMAITAFQAIPIVATALVAGFPLQCYSVTSTVDVVKKQSITIDQLNNKFIVLGIVGEPVGELVRITGTWKESQAKPGRHLAIESVNGKPANHLVPSWFIEGELPTLKLGVRFSFSARSTLAVGMPESDFNPHNVSSSPFNGYYSKLQVMNDEVGNRPVKPKQAPGDGGPRGPSPYGPTLVKPKQ